MLQVPGWRIKGSVSGDLVGVSGVIAFAWVVWSSFVYREIPVGP